MQFRTVAYLNETGYLGEGESTFTKQEDGSGFGKENAADEEKDGTKKEHGGMALEQVLEECTGLKYLELESMDMEDFSFIRKLPDLYAFRLCLPEHSEETVDRSSLFGENDYPQVKCLVVDDKWLLFTVPCTLLQGIRPIKRRFQASGPSPKATFHGPDALQFADG